MTNIYLSITYTVSIIIDMDICGNFSYGLTMKPIPRIEIK